VDKEQAIKGWPLDERPRERLLDRGPEALSDAQLLAILLRSGSERTNAVQLGMGLLERFGSLSSLSQTSAAELCSIHGIGPAKAAQLLAALEIGRRSQSRRLAPSDKIQSSQDVYNHFHPLLRGLKKELFKIILLDGKNKIIRHLTVSEGSLNFSVVHPREVFNPAVRDSAASVIFLHNHPSGEPHPSKEDIESTRRLVAVGGLLGIEVLDHVIIGDGEYFSFADRGLIDRMSEETRSSSSRSKERR
jgi:DNA repair protein RadC